MKMQKTWYALLVLALAIQGCTGEKEPAELLAGSEPGTGRPGATAATPLPDAGAGGTAGDAGERAGGPGATAEQGSRITPPHALCTENVTVSYRCWTDKSAPDVNSKSDIACRFTVTCCGSTVSEWTKAYPQSAGPSGVVYSDEQQLSFRCNDDLDRLGDLDGDGAPNASDSNPLEEGETGYPW